MKNTKNAPVQKELSAPISSSNQIRKAIVAGIEKNNSGHRTEESSKLIRRYSFDDNGGSYSGL